MNSIWTIPLAVAFLVLVGVWHRQTTRTARALAKRYGLSFRAKFLGFRMEGTVQGVPVTYWTEMGNNGSGACVAFRADLSGLLPVGIYFAKDFGPRYDGYQTGVPALDDGYKLYGSNPDGAVLALIRTPAVRDALTSLVASYRVTLYEGQLEARGRKPVGGRQISSLERMLEELLAATHAIRDAAASKIA